jgi:uncharacterized membrane protein YccC
MHTQLDISVSRLIVLLPTFQTGETVSGYFCRFRTLSPAGLRQWGNADPNVRKLVQPQPARHLSRARRTQPLAITQRFSLRDFAYTVELTLACLTTFWIITGILRPFVENASDNLLGGMWAVVATVFVFRDTRDQSLSAGISRMIATCVSFALCLAYLLFLPFNPAGMAALIGIGTVSTMLLGRRNEIVTTGITTAVVMVVAALSPAHAWRQPLLRLLDTIVGVTVGLMFAWIGSLFFRKWTSRFTELGEADLSGKGETNV